MKNLHETPPERLDLPVSADRAPRCFLASYLLLSWSCGASPMHASADWERGESFAPSKTFCIARSPWIPKQLTTEQASLLAVVENTAKGELNKKGYHEAAPAQAELIATPYFIKRERAGIFDSTGYCGAYDVKIAEGAVVPRALVGTCEESYISKFEEGTLLIDMYDAKLDELVWHGWASTEMPEKDAKLTPQLLERATIDILAKFPP
jgi:hypothetical protein